MAKNIINKHVKRLEKELNRKDNISICIANHLSLGKILIKQKLYKKY